VCVSGVTLNIEPGVTFHIHPNIGFLVLGRLLANGLSKKVISFLPVEKTPVSQSGEQLKLFYQSGNHLQSFCQLSEQLQLFYQLIW